MRLLSDKKWCELPIFTTDELTDAPTGTLPTPMARSTSVEEKAIHNAHAMGSSADAPAPPAPEALDLVLDREELEMLQVFHRSFKLPGLRHGLLKLVCSEDYYPEEEEAPQLPSEGAAPARYHEPTAAERLEALRKQTEALRVQADEVLEEEEILEEEPTPPPPAVRQEAGRPSSSGAHVRVVRPSSAARTAPLGTRPPPRR